MSGSFWVTSLTIEADDRSTRFLVIRVDGWVESCSEHCERVAPRGNSMGMMIEVSSNGTIPLNLGIHNVRFDLGCWVLFADFLDVRLMNYVSSSAGAISWPLERDL